jgi:hypothetical protein
VQNRANPVADSARNPPTQNTARSAGPQSILAGCTSTCTRPARLKRAPGRTAGYHPHRVHVGLQVVCREHRSVIGRQVHAREHCALRGRHVKLPALGRRAAGRGGGGRRWPRVGGPLLGPRGDVQRGRGRGAPGVKPLHARNARPPPGACRARPAPRRAQPAWRTFSWRPPLTGRRAPFRWCRSRRGTACVD